MILCMAGLFRMLTLAVIAQKGGCGKTTVAISLACAGEINGQASVIIDLDPQASACNWSDRRGSDQPIVTDAQPARLPNALEKAREAGVQLVVIDTPPRSETASLAAAKSADLILIPCRAQIADLETVPHVAQMLALADEKPALAVLNAVPARGARQAQAKTALSNYGIPVCPVTLGHRAAFGDAGALGLSVLEYQPGGKASGEITALFKYIIRHVDNYTSGDVDNESQSRFEYRIS